MKKELTVFLLLLGLLFACKPAQPPSPLSVTSDSEALDLSDIENAGELIAVTLSGPENFYTYRGKELGQQFALAENFANSMGLKLRMEIAMDTTSLVEMVKEEHADLIACLLPDSIIEGNDLTPCGNCKGGNHWAVRAMSHELADALGEWYSPERSSEILLRHKNIQKTPRVRFRARAVYKDRSHGVISDYDNLFIKASQITQWDWRLIAAMVYQESAFDPQATSWAGAKGLMQVMPSTASDMGISPTSLTIPEVNIQAGARYITMLEKQFTDIRNPQERKKFILASYNGGSRHVRDAMRLAEKYGKNPQVWDEVSYFVLHLSDARFYRDPVCKNGYMIGNETYNYVYNILDRWANYRGVMPARHPSGENGMGLQRGSKKTNRFTRNNNDVLGRDDSVFTSFGE